MPEYALIPKSYSLFPYFKVVPCLILGLFRRFFHSYASILAQSYKGWVGWKRGGAGRGGRVGREEENPPGEDTGPPVTPRWS